MKWLLRLLGLELSPEEKRLNDALTAKIEEMKKYGGRIVVSKGGGIRDEFDTEEGRAAYYKAVTSRVFNKE